MKKFPLWSASSQRAIACFLDGRDSIYRASLSRCKPFFYSQQRPDQHLYSTSRQHGLCQATIFALSTPPGRSAIAVIRLSGPACLSIYRALCPGKADPVPRYAAVRKLFAPDKPPTSTSLLDPSALILYFPAPKTVTGEDVLELHVHGGPAIVQAVLRAIPRCSVLGDHQSIRFAEPGEFTKRAFLNGKLDLTQAEALGDTLSATTEQQRRLSVRGASGALSRQYDAWRTQLLYARGELEALIDFSEDQHFDESTNELLASVSSQIRALIRLLQTHAQNAVRGELLRSGISISLLGAPNAGKSSLLNRIVGREAAIVSQEAGTTRDIVEVGVDLGGYYCRFGDTAGLRGDAVGNVEKEGMRRARLRAIDSDVVIVVFNFQQKDRGVELQLDSEVVQTANLLMQDEYKVVIVLNKIDLVSDPTTLATAASSVQSAITGIDASRVFPISCTSDADSPASIQQLMVGLSAHFDRLTSAMMPENQTEVDRSVWEESLGATERHRLLLEECIKCLDEFMSIAVTAHDSDDDADIVVAAEHLRSAAESLAKITGRGDAGDVEEVLGVVFEKFCVGK